MQTPLTNTEKTWDCLFTHSKANVLHNKRQQDYFENWIARKERKPLVVSGRKGVGKTFFTMAMLKHLLPDYEIIFIDPFTADDRIYKRVNVGGTIEAFSVSGKKKKKTAFKRVMTNLYEGLFENFFLCPFGFYGPQKVILVVKDPLHLDFDQEQKDTREIPHFTKLLRQYEKESSTANKPPLIFIVEQVPQFLVHADVENLIIAPPDLAFASNFLKLVAQQVGFQFQADVNAPLTEILRLSNFNLHSFAIRLQGIYDTLKREMPADQTRSVRLTGQLLEKFIPMYASTDPNYSSTAQWWDSWLNANFSQENSNSLCTAHPRILVLCKTNGMLFSKQASCLFESKFSKTLNELSSDSSAPMLTDTAIKEVCTFENVKEDSDNDDLPPLVLGHHSQTPPLQTPKVLQEVCMSDDLPPLTLEQLPAPADIAEVTEDETELSFLFSLLSHLLPGASWTHNKKRTKVQIISKTPITHEQLLEVKANLPTGYSAQLKTVSFAPDKHLVLLNVPPDWTSKPFACLGNCSFATYVRHNLCRPTHFIEYVSTRKMVFLYSTEDQQKRATGLCQFLNKLCNAAGNWNVVAYFKPNKDRLNLDTQLSGFQSDNFGSVEESCAVLVYEHGVKQKSTNSPYMQVHNSVVHRTVPFAELHAASLLADSLARADWLNSQYEFPDLVEMQPESRPSTTACVLRATQFAQVYDLDRCCSDKRGFSGLAWDKVQCAKKLSLLGAFLHKGHKVDHRTTIATLNLIMLKMVTNYKDQFVPWFHDMLKDGSFVFYQDTQRVKTNNNNSNAKKQTTKDEDDDDEAEEPKKKKSPAGKQAAPRQTRKVTIDMSAMLSNMSLHHFYDAERIYNYYHIYFEHLGAPALLHKEHCEALAFFTCLRFLLDFKDEKEIRAFFTFVQAFVNKMGLLHEPVSHHQQSATVGSGVLIKGLPVVKHINSWVNICIDRLPANTLLDQIYSILCKANLSAITKKRTGGHSYSHLTLLDATLGFAMCIEPKYILGYQKPNFTESTKRKKAQTTNPRKTLGKQ